MEVLIYVTACSYRRDVNFPRKILLFLIDSLMNVTSHKRRCVFGIFGCHRNKFFLHHDFIDLLA